MKPRVMVVLSVLAAGVVFAVPERASAQYGCGYWCDEEEQQMAAAFGGSEGCYEGDEYSYRYCRENSLGECSYWDGAICEPGNGDNGGDGAFGASRTLGAFALPYAGIPSVLTSGGDYVGRDSPQCRPDELGTVAVTHELEQAIQWVRPTAWNDPSE